MEYHLWAGFSARQWSYKSCYRLQWWLSCSLVFMWSQAVISKKDLDQNDRVSSLEGFAWERLWSDAVINITIQRLFVWNCDFPGDRIDIWYLIRTLHLGWSLWGISLWIISPVMWEIHQVECGISTKGTNSESMCTLVGHLSSVHCHCGSN